MKTKYFLAALFCGFLWSCQSDHSDSHMLYESDAFKVYTDSVVQGPYKAVALSGKEITSNYQSPANATYSRHIEFKFSVNGKDNELPFGVNHHLLLYPDSNGEVRPETITFGKADESIPETPVNDFLEPNTKLHLKVDMRQVMQDFKEKGYHIFGNGDKMMASDFKGLYIAGGSDPLSWDFENLPARDHLQLHDKDGDGIYEITLDMNVYNPENYTAQGWTLSKDISRYPEFISEKKMLNALYNLSLEETLLDIRKDGTFMAGEKWEGVWTRDISYSILLSLAIIEPEVAKASLMKKVKNGRIIQDTGTGGSWPVSSDRMTWTLAAWEIYRVTGDRNWLKTIYPIIKKSAEEDLKVIYHAQTGLMKGESSFLDWRKQSYPLWMNPVDIYESLNLGTNAVHYRTYEILAEMTRILGEPTNNYIQIAQAIKKGMNEFMWSEQKGYYGQYLYGRNFYTLSPRSEALGESLTILFDIADEERRKKVIENTPVTAYGIPSIYPQIPDIPPYHNNGIWPFVQAYWNWAAAKAGNSAALEQGLGSLYRQAMLFVTNKENFVAENGDYKGTEVNSDRQLWSVAGNLAMVYRVFFGMEFNEEGLHFSPFVPKSYEGIKKLNNFRYRNATLNITLRGHGNQVKHVYLDSQSLYDHTIPSELEGEHTVVIELQNRKLPNRAFNLVKNAFSPASPNVSSDPKLLQWKEVAGAEKYKIYRDGAILDEAKETSYAPEWPNTMSNYQVSAVDEKGFESFLSEPLSQTSDRLQHIVEAEKYTKGSDLKLGDYTGDGFIELTKTQNTSIEFKVNVPEDGEYLVDFRYSNGSGPVNTDNKCAIRSLYKENDYQGAVVLPQRGFEEWSNWAYSNAVRVVMKKGKQNLKLSFEPFNENMNEAVNRAMIDHLRIRKVTSKEITKRASVN